MKLLTVKGIPIKLHGSFLAFTAILALLNGMSGGIPAAAQVVGAMFILLVCVVLHELGHALMAQVFGINTEQIIMTPLGGLALLEQPLMNTKCEVWVAIAGPAVNFILVGMTAPLMYVISSEWLLWFIAVNLMLGFFNLVPAFPMDGGRILRAILAKKHGYKKGTLKAINVARVFAYVFVAFGVFKAPMLALIGIFLLIVAHQQRRYLENENYREAGD